MEQDAEAKENGIETKGNASAKTGLEDLNLIEKDLLLFADLKLDQPKEEMIDLVALEETQQNVATISQHESGSIQNSPTESVNVETPPQPQPIESVNVEIDTPPESPPTESMSVEIDTPPKSPPTESMSVEVETPPEPQPIETTSAEKLIELKVEQEMQSSDDCGVWFGRVSRTIMHVYVVS